MKEFGVKIEEQFTKGLDPSDVVRGNLMGLTSCVNLAPSPVGLIKDVQLVKAHTTAQLTDVDIYPSWTDTAVFNGSNSYVITKGPFARKMTKGLAIASTWATCKTFAGATISELTMLSNWVNPTHFQHVDLISDSEDKDGTICILTNNLCFAMYKQYTRIVNSQPVATYETLYEFGNYPTVCCKFKGGVILFAEYVGEDNFWNASVKGGTVQAPTYSVASPMGGKYVSWTSVGGGDMLSHAIKSVAELHGEKFVGTTAAMQPLFYDFLAECTAGYIIVPTGGTILGMKQIGDVVVVYCTDGLFAMQWSAQFATFGVRRLSNIACAGRTCFGGTDYYHIFISDDGTLFSIDAQLRVEKLGYKIQMLALIGHGTYGTRNVNIYVDSYERFLIASSSGTYILTKDGMRNSNQVIFGVLDNGYAEVLTDATTAFETITHYMDFGVEGTKFLSFVTAEYDNLGASVSATVYYIINGVSREKTVLFNSLGVAYFGIAFDKLAIKLSGTVTSSQGRISRVEFKLNRLNRNFVRGVEAQ